MSQPLPRAVFRFLKLTIIICIILNSIYILSIFHPSPNIPYPRKHPVSITTSNRTLGNPTIGKVTASFGPLDPPYELAIASHNIHNTLHNYPSLILREQILSGLWSKHAHLLTMLGIELSKPAHERLEWLFWSDRDTIVMNPLIPLNVFLPPRGFEHVNLLVTRDRNGLNNGVFFVRVHASSFKFFASALSIREYLPELELKYTEQSGMEEVFQRPWWNSSVLYMPQRWFNGFPPSLPPKSLSSASARPGSLLIHFASNRDGLRPERMAHWSEVAHSKDPSWYKQFNETGYPAEIAEYWARVGKEEDVESICEDIGQRVWK